MSRLGAENLLYSRFARLLRALQRVEGELDKESYHRSLDILKEVYGRMRRQLQVDFEKDIV